MITLDYAQKTKVPYQRDNDVIALRFPTEIAKADVIIGAPVVLQSDGSVAYPTGTGQLPFGHIVAMNNRYEASPDGLLELTVNTRFTAVVVGTADGGSCDTGSVAACSGVDATNKRGKYAYPALATEYVCGLFLAGGADTEEVTVGLFDQPFLGYVD